MGFAAAPWVPKPPSSGHGLEDCPKENKRRKRGRSFDIPTHDGPDAQQLDAPTAKKVVEVLGGRFAQYSLALGTSLLTTFGS